MASAAPALEARPVVRRQLPREVRRKRFLIAVADHSLLIAASITRGSSSRAQARVV